MPDEVILQYTTSRWKGREVTFRIGYLIVKVKCADDSDSEIESTFVDVLDPSYVIEARIGRWAYIRVPINTEIPIVAETL